MRVLTLISNCQLSFNSVDMDIVVNVRGWDSNVLLKKQVGKLLFG